MNFTIDDLIDEMRKEGTLTPDQETAATEIKSKARELGDKYLRSINEALDPFAEN